MLSVLYLQWLPGWSEFSLNFTLTRCVHFSIEMIRPLFRVKWRLFSQTTQHLLVVSNSLEAMMILIALSDSWHRLLHFQCSDWVTQFTKVLLAELFFSLLRLVPRNKKKITCSKGCAQLHCFSCRWPKTPTWLNAFLRSIPPPLEFLKTSWI